LHASPKKVLHLGLGTGITAAGTLDYPGIVSVTIVELIPEVVEAASYLGEGNQKLFEDSRVQIRIDDARHDLLSHQDEYDVIISDLFVPWESQTGYLYTQEHFQSAKTRLRVNGLYCQWLPLYQMGLQEFQMITDTFASVFPQTTLWWGHLNPNKPMIALIGSEESLELLKPALEERLERLNAKLEPNDSWLSNPERLRLLSIGSWKLHPQPVFNTDEHPRIEFLTPLSHLDRRLITGPRLKECYEKFFEKLSPITPSMTDEHQHQIHEEQKIMLTLD
jgi:spermidine synthase